ncbi:HNH endonuclease [Burkholderia vietnamiensis]|uniref:HNH endonuclease n=1 Tax=Burkholderia vietnamiensis TaxID=60552 RepID=UPI0009BDFF4E|nr:HNH endonuclease [Burkholderia vietnamiensis]
MPTREQRARKLGIPIDQLPDGRGKKPSSWNNTKRGSDHHRWNNGRMLSNDGYVKVRVGVEHPLADPNGYAYEHLIVWVSAGNSRPAAGFHLHHKNENRTDNRYSNLELLTIPEHAAEHGRLKLTASAARAIREKYFAGEATQAQLAAEYTVPHQRISRVIKGLIWKNAGGPISNEDNRQHDPADGRFVNKHVTGRELDGPTHDEFPEAR